MGWYEAIKDVAALAQKADNVELMRKVLDLQTEMMLLSQENISLKKRLQDLEEQTRIQGKLAVLGGAYWIQTETDRQGPYCTVCWDVDRRLVRLTEGATRDSFYCGYCPTRYKG